MLEKSFELQRWNFKLERFKWKTLHEYAKKMVPKDSKVCIAYGNMSQKNSRIKGSIRFPIASFKKVLQERGATVITIDEHRTTMICSECHNVCDPVKPHEVPVDQRINQRTYIRRRGRFPKKRCFIKKKEETKSEYCEFLRCNTTDCINKYSQRDLNSSRNHLMLLRELLRTKNPKERPAEFRRHHLTPEEIIQLHSQSRVRA
jgi:hypothetical protein